MTLCEYENVKRYNYLEYCDYLQRKYGVGLCDYMTANWRKKHKVTRTKEGLFAHHKYESHAQRLSDEKEAQKHPFEWQLKENIVYCDFLEHLLLHILICESQPKKKRKTEIFGFIGIVSYIVPELNDVYSGWVSQKTWQYNCHKKIIAQKQVYYELLKRFISFYENDEDIIQRLCSSSNACYGWPIENNYVLFDEIELL